MSTPDNGRDSMQVLTEAYDRQIPDRLRDIEEALAALASRWDRDVLDGLYRLAHRLAGSAGIYGYTGLSAAAGALEDFVVAAMEDPSSPEGDQDRLRTLVDAVKLVAAAERRPEGGRARGA
jgi:chemotaxis protein histidine kinase CheA